MGNSTNAKTLLYLFLSCISSQCIGQRKLHSPDSSYFTQQIQFIQEAPTILSQSIANKDWTAIENFITNWRLSDRRSAEIIFSIQVLLEIQQEKFSVLHFPCDYMYLLEDYSKELDNSVYSPGKFKYYIRLNADYRYDATADLVKVFTVLHKWSEQLIVSYKLKGTKLFLCQVFEGKIEQPRKSFRANEDSYAELKAYNKGLTYNNSAYLSYQRNRKTGTAALVLGSWFPTGNLKVVGVHPIAGFLVGGRNSKNEYDLVFGFRFINAPHHYTVLRSDSLIVSNYYFGGYLGFDYTRYLIHKKRFEIGFTTGVAYDSFNFTNSETSDHSDISLDPLEIKTFDFNNGFRMKYFIRANAYLGLALKYHLLNYCNHGGTDLKGNAFSIELLYGSH